MGIEKLWRLDRRWFWIFSFLWFLIIELLLRMKPGVLFCLAFGWFLVLEWQAKSILKMEFSDNRFLKILKSIYQAFLITLLIFLVFSLLNAACRSFDNSILFFQLP